ncbi:apolipoprotein A-IV-like [Pseudonaja textilis]|uniref:apolipoprotein A-IV-like n=1 Tax=Pseudonaja textilis TaxID=8673 RepID=UPI000EA99C55|nr:apolipoprotein A-IV-like [Pseudonaja textilis]
MKFLILAFAIFSASQAYVLRDEPYPHLAKLNEELLEYMQNVTRMVNEKVDYIQNLELSQAMLDRLHHTYLKISEHLNYLESKLPPDVPRTYYTALAMSMGLVEKGIDAVNNFKRQVTPVTDKVAESLYSIVAPFANSVLEKMGPYSEVLRRAVSTSVERLNPRLSEKLKKLLEKMTKELAPLIQTLQNELQELKASLQPATDHVQKKVKESLKRINEELQPYIAPILETLEKYTKASPVEP